MVSHWSITQIHNHESVTHTLTRVGIELLGQLKIGRNLFSDKHPTCSVPFHRPPHLSSWPQNRFEMPCKMWSLSVLSIYSGLKILGKTS